MFFKLNATLSLLFGSILKAVTGAFQNNGLAKDEYCDEEDV